MPQQDALALLFGDLSQHRLLPIEIEAPTLGSALGEMQKALVGALASGLQTVTGLWQSPACDSHGYKPGQKHRSTTGLGPESQEKPPVTAVAWEARSTQAADLVFSDVACRAQAWHSQTKCCALRTNAHHGSA